MVLNNNPTKLTNNIKDQCAFCGACESVCPSNSINIDIDYGIYKLKIDNTKCNNCGLCIKVCPIYYWSVHDLDAIHKRDFQFLECWLYKSKNRETIDKSSSGGFITDFLINSFELDISSKTLVTQQLKRDGYFIAKPILTNSIENIRKSAGSKYIISPVASKINEILFSDERIIVVGLPCHIRAFKLAEKMYPRFKENIILYISLVCAHNTHPIINKAIIDKEYEGEEIDDLFYRKSNWPGHYTVKTQEMYQSLMTFPKLWSVFFSHFAFSTKGCLACPEVLGEGDIVCGDPWGLSKNGYTVVLIRTKRGLQLFEDFSLNEIGYIEKINDEEAIFNMYSQNIFNKYTALKHRTNKHGLRLGNLFIYLYNVIIMKIVCFSNQNPKKMRSYLTIAPILLLSGISLILVSLKKLHHIFSKGSDDK